MKQHRGYRSHKWANFREGTIKVSLNLAILAGFGALTRYGYLLFTHEVKPLLGSIIFLLGIVAWILLIKLLRHRYGRVKPSFKLTTFSVIAILLIFTFAGVQPLAQYKDKLIENYHTAQSKRAAEAEMEAAPPLSDSPVYLQAVKLCPGLGSELKKLPETSGGLSPKDLEALDDICALYLDNPQTRQAFDLMMGEGIKEARAYCAPLQALLWVAYDEEFDQRNPLQGYSLEGLLDVAWKGTITSDCYRSERWQDFEEVTDRLSSPALLVVYMRDNFTYDWERYQRWMAGDHPDWDMPKDTFRKRMSDCGGQAVFALHCLLENGYEYDDFDRHTDEAACLLGCWNPDASTYDAHTVLLYKEDGLFYTIDSGVTTSMRGAFTTIEEAATASLPTWRVYHFYNTTRLDYKNRGKNSNSKGKE